MTPPNISSVRPPATRDAARALTPEALELNSLLTTLTRLLVEYTNENGAPDTKVLEFGTPHDVSAALDLRLDDGGADGASPAAGSGQDAIFGCFRAVLAHSVRTGHPLFLDKLYAGTPPIGIAAELLTGALNVNTHVFAVSPVGTLMELACLRELRRVVGYPVDDGAGLMLPGGSMSNLVAMCTARNLMFPRTRTEGLSGMPPLAVFSSAQSHYSIEKAAMVLGLGRNAMFKVRCQPNGRMIPSDLETQIGKAKDKGYIPFFVNGTSGTTVTCAFDPLREIAAIAKRHGLWFHVDGSFGGPIAFTKHRGLLDGIELSNSFTINPHKLLGVPLQCSCLLIADTPATMITANSSKANYLFHAIPAAPRDDSRPASADPDAAALHRNDNGDGDADDADLDSPASPIHAGFGAQAFRAAAAAMEAADQVNGASGGANGAAQAAASAAADEVYDLGNLGIGCGRRADGIKLYLTWRYLGTRGFAARVETAMLRAAQLRARVAAHPRLELVFPSSSAGENAAPPPAAHAAAADGDDGLGRHEMGVNVCFWYVPARDEAEHPRVAAAAAAAAAGPGGARAAWRERVRGGDPAYQRRVASLTAAIRQQIVRRGNMMVDYAPLASPTALPNFFRIPLNAPTVTEAHLDRIVAEIAAVGDEVVASEGAGAAAAAANHATSAN